ncbi:phosphatase [Desulforamulus aquiferis]|uniref:Phosphatase n=1 Tax=Desulforamulus aquiferis TaxID=1397668 RepID=A0AAW7ZHY2_9FIRM|nr:phosphatase [Desulforamulus aquiferis]MDO7788874.1 phosphatase [Desulforamulus aquiferis]
MQKRHLTLLIGPAKYPEDDRRMVSMFLAEPGNKIICGASTAGMVTRVIKEAGISAEEVTGLILVTDGTLILSQVLNMFRDSGITGSLDTDNNDADLLAQALVQADSISLLVGMAVNKSQRSLSLPAKPVVKTRFARELADLLKENGKQVMVEFF